MTVAVPAPVKLSAVTVHSMLEQLEKDRFLKTNFSLTIVDGPHRPFCIRKLAASEQPGTEWALRPVRMTLIAAPGSEILTDHVLLKLSSSVNVLSGLVL